MGLYTGALYLQGFMVCDCHVFHDFSEGALIYRVLWYVIIMPFMIFLRRYLHVPYKICDVEKIKEN